MSGFSPPPRRGLEPGWRSTEQAGHQRIILPALNGTIIADQVNTFGHRRVECGHGRLERIVDVGEVQVSARVARHGLTPLEHRPAYHPARPVKAREPEDDRRGRGNRVPGGHGLFRLPADLARLPERLGRGFFIHPLSRDLAIHARGTRVHDPRHGLRQPFQDILQSLNVNRLPVRARRPIEPDAVKHALDLGKRAQTFRSEHIDDRRLDPQPGDLCGPLG